MNPHYRIAHFIDTSFPGGAEKLLFDLCIQLKQAGHTPVILHLGHDYFTNACQELNIEQHSIPGHRYYKSTRTLWRFAFVFKSFLGEHKIDLLHSHLFGPISGAAAAAFLARIPHIGTLHDIYMIEEKPSRVRLLQLASLLRTKLITVASSMQTFYRQQAYFPKQSICTIYNGVKTNALINCDERIRLRETFNLKANDIVIINVGRLVPLKRHDLLLQAIQKIHSKFKLLIVGDGPQLEQIKRDISTLKLENEVIVTGQRKDVDKLLAISDLFVQCSDTEGLSMSIMEAMAAKLPCVVTDVGGNHELIKHNINGYLCPPSDPSALANCLTKLISDQALRNNLGEKALQSCIEMYSHELTMKHYLDLYYNTLAGRQ